MLRAIALLLGTSLVTLLACSQSALAPCSNDCPLATAEFELVSGTASIFTLDGIAVTVPIIAATGGQVPAETCAMFGNSPNVSAATPGIRLELLSDNSVNGFLYMICNVSGQEFGTFLFSGKVADPRELNTSSTQEVGFGSCNTDASTTATITLTESMGDIAPYPDMVSADYRRSFSVELDTETLDCASIALTAGCPICQQFSRAQAKFSLAQTAASYSYTENAPCQCE